jgi:hypothetical protein
VSDTTSARTLNVNNSRFEGSGQIYIQSNNLELGLNKCTVFGATQSIAINSSSNKVKISNCDFNSGSFVVAGNSSDASATVYADGYTFAGNKVNFARNIAAGSNIVIQNNISPVIEDFETSVGDFNIAAQYTQGTRLFFRNTHPSVARTILAPLGETINGESSIPLAFNHGVAVRKISTTAWITESENNPARLSDVDIINFWTRGMSSVWRPTGNVGIGTSVESQITDRLTVFGSQPFIKISNSGFGTNIAPQRTGISFFGAGGAAKFGEISLLDRSIDNGFGNLDFRVYDGTAIQTALSLNGNGLTVTAMTGIQYNGLTTTERDALTGLTEGRLIWNTTTKSFNSYDGATWHEIPKIIKASATLNFPSTGAHSGSDLTVTVTGAAIRDGVVIQPDPAAILANACYTAWVSATNTVTVRYNHYGSGSSDPASNVFDLTIIKR